MTINVAWLQNVSYSAQVDRMLVNALVPTEGVTMPLALKVTPQSPSAMTVRVDAGAAFVTGRDSPNQGMYFVHNDASANTATFSVPAAGYQRIDSVCVKVQDPDGSGPAGNNAVIEIVQGAAVLNSQTPAEPSLTGSRLRLANVLLSSSTSTIISSNITDKRGLCGGLDHVGTTQLWTGSGTLLPSGWLDCNGQSLSRSTYAELFELIGTAFGSVDGSTFSLPDYRCRGPVGVGTGVGLTGVWNMGTQYGLESVAISEAQMPWHAHSISHQHGAAYTADAGTHGHGGAWLLASGAAGWGILLSEWGTTYGGVAADGNHSHWYQPPAFYGSSDAKGGNVAHENRPPSLGTRFIIRAQ